MDVARLEYEYSFLRAEKYDNKIYVLLTVCGFVLVMFTWAVGDIGSIDIFSPAKSGWIMAYDVLIVMCVLGLVTVLVRLIDGMSGLNMRRHDSDEILKRDMLSKTPREIALFTIISYENAKEYNNEQLERRYKSLNITVKMLLVVVILLVALTIVSSFAVKAGL
ncbi:MAG: hypothetical protein IJP86_07455 [Synergistaceae bacterium]|nr:hypothetical protein [Synergistaceae bacterium]